MQSSSLYRSLMIGLAGLGALAAASVVAREAAGNAFALSNPKFALRAVPHQPAALARMLETGFARTGMISGPGSPQIDNIEAALRSEPLSADLIGLLAIVRGASGNPQAARTLMGLAERTSRRDLLTQLWMIEDAVGRDDVAQALRHYDIALTTSQSAPAILFPVLTQALSQPQVRSGLAYYLARNRPWMDAFLAGAIADGQPREVAQLLADTAPARHDPAFHSVQEGLIGLFVTRKDYDGLRQYVAMLPRADVAAIRSIGFTEETTGGALRPLTWELIDDADLRARFAGGNRLKIMARAGTRGVVARRILFLPSGRWRLRQAVAVPNDMAPADASWEWGCLTSGGAQPFWKQPIVPRAPRFETDIDVPKRCQAIEIRIDAGAGIDADDTSLMLSILSLTRHR